MKALVLSQHGGLENLQCVTDYPMPVVQDGHVIIKVGASSFNYHDVYIKALLRSGLEPLEEEARAVEHVLCEMCGKRILDEAVDGLVRVLDISNT
jgi:NADPH:quinone reductase-like Zn-dependent oxidoreductase